MNRSWNQLFLTALIVVSVCCGGLAKGDDRVPAPAQHEKQADEKPNRKLLIKVFGLDEKPLAKANIHRAVWTKEKPYKANDDVVTNEDGQVTVELPATFYILRLWARKDGLIPLFAHWEQDELSAGEDAVPKEFTFRLKQGTTIGGSIHNVDGKPIKGAKVEVLLIADPVAQFARTCFNIWLAEGDGARTTDAQGFWTLDNIPPGDETRVLVKLSHPDYIDDKEWGGLQNEQKVTMKSLRDLSSTIVMQPGTSVTGTVSDPDGKPIADAVVVWGDNPYFKTGSQEVRTDEKGVYRFPPIPPGTWNFTVIAKDWAPSLKAVDVSTAKPQVDFTLKPGKTIRIRFIDDAGKPVPDVYVGIAGWREIQSLYNHKHPNVLDTRIPGKSDEKGVYQWTWAPDDEVLFRFGKEGFREAKDRSLKARDADHEIRLVKE